MRCDNIDAKSVICGISTLIVYEKTFLFTNKAERTHAQLTLKAKVVKMSGPKSLLRVATLKVNVTTLKSLSQDGGSHTVKVSSNNAQQERPDQKSEAIDAFDIDVDELLDMLDLEGV